MSNQPMSPGKKAPLAEGTNEEGHTLRLAHGLEIGRDQILGRFWELANLAPERTKGNITGQLKALDSLCEELARARGDKHKSPVKHVRSPEIYRPPWIATPDGKHN
jgi:hypothetical protein